LEDKQFTLTVHYRGMDMNALPRLNERVAEIARRHALRASPGKCVINVVPNVATGKGAAALEIVRDFGGDVLLVRAADGEHPEMRMRTSFLHIVSAKSLALTDRQVTISDDEQSITGRGMEYNNELGRLTLHERVRSRIEPEKSKP
ncbi:MAG: LPS export ABC transporter periplasmic protein LptC, partial [Burkholderiales bacterium]